MEAILNKINAQLEDFKAKRAALVKELQTEFPALLLPFLQQSKKIDSIGWTQYTPYFNDGDECVFGVNNDDLFVNGEREETPFLERTIYKQLATQEDVEQNKKAADVAGYKWYKDRKIGEQGLAINPEYDPAEVEVVENIKKVLKQVPEDFYKDLFGDHCQVTVKKDGTIETDSYDHD